MRILIATGNPGKYREIAAVLGQAEDMRAIRWLSLRDLPKQFDEPVEAGSTFAANASLKAIYYSLASGLWTLADDSGLEVDALGGAPGVYSARYAGSPKGALRAEADGANNRKLIRALGGTPADRRTARFRCALALADGDRILAAAEGAIAGVIIDEPRGGGGFGYDPHFLVPSLGKTTAELEAEHKNRISHRGQALRKLADILPALLRGARPC